MLDVLYSRALAPFVTDAICLPAVLEFLYGLSPSVRNDDAQLSSYCKRTVRTMWHYHGGCVVGKVVDADYRVLGTNALRVIDGSTFVNSPGTNPQATVMMLGRYVHARVHIPCICLGCYSLDMTLWVVMRRVLHDFLTNPVVMLVDLIIISFSRFVCRYMGVQILRERLSTGQY